VYSVPQFDHWNKLHLRLSIKTSSNRPECERFLNSAKLLGCSWCCWWRLFKSMTTEALSTTLIIHSFRCRTVFFPSWHNPVSFLNVFISICVTEHLWQWCLIWQWQSCCISDLSTDVYLISDWTIMLFPCISSCSSLHYSSSLDRHTTKDYGKRLQEAKYQKHDPSNNKEMDLCISRTFLCACVLMEWVGGQMSFRSLFK